VASRAEYRLHRVLESLLHRLLFPFARRAEYATRKGGHVSSIRFHNVSFSYDADPAGLLSGVDFGVSEGWTGVIGPNGTGKTTLLQLATAELEPRTGAVNRPQSTLYCPQRTDDPMTEFQSLLDNVDGDAFRIRGRLGIEEDWLSRWETLSHGERKRAQIGTCLWLRPELLAVDEPTNHLDRRARALVSDALASFRGIGLLVSHDRDLLDSLCSHVLFIDPPNVELRSGGYTTAMGELQVEAENARDARTRARKDRKRLEREAAVRRVHVQKAEKKKSLRGVDPRDSDARAKAYAAKNTDGQSGKRLRQLEGRLEQVADREASIDVKRPEDLGIELRGATSSRNALIRLAAGRLDLGKTRSMAYPDLIVQPSDRVALVGPNGSGKSTLVRHIVEDLALPENRVVYISQEIPAEESTQILASVRGMPSDLRGRSMSWISRLGSDPKRLLASALPSPGEVRKLILARHLAYEPHLVIMDEPTNHMDLPSIECVEAALGDFPGALLLVSHDERFLKGLTTVRWEIEADTPSDEAFTLHVRSALGGG